MSEWVSSSELVSNGQTRDGRHLVRVECGEGAAVMSVSLVQRGTVLDEADEGNSESKMPEKARGEH